ncbi:MAG: radical SAM protein [Thermoleophilia bacterium]|nr:radical SAM protein [Thermoleophilia bacterium]
MSTSLPRLPLDGNLDLTYRCNNDCRHCWLRLPPGAPERPQELSLDEIKDVVDQARQMGCRAWAISGGEPMLRLDFAEIFDYVTRKSARYSLNTNGTLITPEIAKLMTRRGAKMVALYGATAAVHDHVTRSPGSFETAMRGFAYLTEAGAGFTVQVIPMRDNYHQYGQMVELARSLSPHYRVGAPWLWFTACGSEARNREIARQRLGPADVVALDEPDPAAELLGGPGEGAAKDAVAGCGAVAGDDRLFASCIAARRDFHIDPYGKMSFCSFIKDPALRYDLRRGSFQQAWDEFIPSLAEVVRGGDEYRENCGSCDLRSDCRWCAVYGYLEHGRYSAKVDYLCGVARENRRFKEAWKKDRLRYYGIGGVRVQVSADFPFTDTTFDPKLEKFRVDGPGADTVTLKLVSSIPALSEFRLGQEVYRKVPWAIYRSSGAWVYVGISPGDAPDERAGEDHPHCIGVFSDDHTRGTVYREADFYTRGGLGSLTTFPSDQILLARLLADRQGCYLHASGFVLDGQGLLFVGHSEAGKSTTMKLLREHGEILCDDRIIVRRWPDGFRIHGTWSHGELPDVSPAEAPLRALLLLEKAGANELLPVIDKRERLGGVLSHVIKPMVSADWWEKTLDIAHQIATEAPIYRLRFDKSGEIVGLLKELCTSPATGA